MVVGNKDVSRVCDVWTGVMMAVLVVCICNEVIAVASLNNLAVSWLLLTPFVCHPTVLNVVGCALRYLFVSEPRLFVNSVVFLELMYSSMTFNTDVEFNKSYSGVGETVAFLLPFTGTVNLAMNWEASDSGDDVA